MSNYEYESKEYYVNPKTKVYETGVSMTTWKYDHDQSKWHFELKLPVAHLSKIDSFEIEPQGTFIRPTDHTSDYRFKDYLESITNVKYTKDYLVIRGMKETQSVEIDPPF